MRRSRFVIGVLMVVGAASYVGMPARAGDGGKPIPATAPAVRRADENGMKLIHAVAEGRANDAMALIKSGMDVNGTCERGGTAIYYASFDRDCSKFEVLKALVEHGANVNGPGTAGFTPLHQACGYGNSTIVGYLIGKGADTKARERIGGDTPLHVAAYCVGHALADSADQSKTIELLLAHGADVNAVDNDGKTPLDLLNEQSKDPAIAKLLVSKGAKLGKELAPPATQKSR